MRKLVLLSYAILLALLSSGYHGWLTKQTELTALFRNQHVLQLERDKGTDIREVLQRIARQQNVVIAQYYYVNEQEMIIYTTDEQATRRMTRDLSLTIRPFAETKNIGLSTQLYVSRLANKQAFEQQLQRYAVFRWGEAPTSLLAGVQLSTLFLIAISFLSYVVLLFVTFHHQSEQIKLYRLWGYSWFNIASIWQKPLFIVYSMSLFVVSFMTNFQWQNIVFGLVVYVLTIIVPFSSTIVLLSFAKRTVPLAVILKAVVLVSLCFTLSEALTVMQTWKGHVAKWSHWTEMKDIYRLQLNISSSSLVEERQMNDRVQTFYEGLVRTRQAWLIQAENFTVMNDGRYQYERNKTDRYGPYGRHIVINENYMKRHPIATLDGHDARRAVIHEPNTLNVLVPQHLRAQEAQLREQYRKWFLFQKRDSDNIYRAALKQPLNRLTEEELTIHFIYVNDRQRYATYNAWSGDERSLVHDALATIYTGHFDSSWILAACTTSVYFVDQSQQQAYVSLASLLQRTKADEVNGTISVYQQLGEALVQSERQLQQSVIALVSVVISSFVLMYVLIVSYYRLHLQRQTIHYLTGYSFMRNNRTILLINMTLWLVVTGVSFALNWWHIPFGFLVGLLLFEIALLIYLDMRIVRSNLATVMKGME